MAQLVDQFNKPLRKESSSTLYYPSARAIVGGKLTRTKATSYSGFNNFFTVQSPEQPDQSWQLLNLDEQSLSQLSSQKLLELLVNLSPEVNLALWHFLRFCNPGYSIVANKKSAQKVIDNFLGRLDIMYGSVDILLSKIFTGVFLRGAIFLELVLNREATEATDLAILDPSGARFREIYTEERGEIWELGQYQDGDWVSFEDDDTIIYASLDPEVDGYYGRSLISSSLFAAVFLLGLLHDLRRVINQQGYPRLDISIDIEKLAQSMPLDSRDNPEKLESWITRTIEEISSYYTNLQPDDAFVHTDAVSVNSTSATAASLQGLETIIRFVERMLIRSLKSSPILMGSNESVTETHADRQWEIHMAGIRSVQERLRKVLTRLLKIVLQVSGLQSEIEIVFDELDGSEALRRAIAEREITNVIVQQLDSGLITIEQAQEQLQDISPLRKITETFKRLREFRTQQVNDGNIQIERREEESLSYKVIRRQQIKQPLLGGKKKKEKKRK